MRTCISKSFLVVVFCAVVSSSWADSPPGIEDYATIEAYVGKEEIPVYAFGYTYVYGVGPDLLPGIVMQEGNANPIVKFKPKKSWEIKSNFCGSTPAREPKTMLNDDQPLLPVHLIDGDSETAWSSRGGGVPDRQPEWIRIDLPAESTVASVAIVYSQKGPGQSTGKVLPREIVVKLSTDAREWRTVYENKNFSGPDSGPTVIDFPAQRAKQIWIVANNLGRVGNWGCAVSIGEVEARDPEGNNLALISKGAGVQVSSTYYGYGMDRFTQDMLWPIQYDLGFKWLRVGYDMGMYLWSYVEREKGKLEIDRRADECITEAHKNGMNVILVLDKGNWLYADPPRKVDWKKARTCEMMETYYDYQPWPSQSKELMDGYLRYVDYMVRHFKGRVAYYEICNEWERIPWEDYHRILLATIPVIKKADPKAKILLGSATLAPDGGGGIYDKAVLPCLKLNNGELAKQIDAVGWHPWYQVDPDNPKYRRYWEDFNKFKKDCEALGFKGQYLATEWTWAAPYPPVETKEWWGQFGCSEMQKAKYSAQLMTAHSGMGVVSLYNETFQTGKVDWDCNLVRNVFSVDPISPAQPQPIYYAFRSISTVLDGFIPFDFKVSFTGDKQFDCYTFKRGGEVMLAAWMPGRTMDGVVEARTDVTLPAAKVKRAWVVDIFNGTEQELNLTPSGGDSVLKGMLVKDYPVFVRVEQ
ncbi:MAG: discoidin domain-containing protein [Armatimonadetes bacterium]|nr:discoidin domain-containing protein [Armatimonadota bacterium]